MGNKCERITVVLKIGRSAVRPRPWLLARARQKAFFGDLLVIFGQLAVQFRGIHCLAWHADIAFERAESIKELGVSYLVCVFMRRHERADNR